MTVTTTNAAIFSAPAGWGKTQKADALAREHGLTTVVDDWGAPPNKASITPGALHLTNLHPDACKRLAPGVHLISRGW